MIRKKNKPRAPKRRKSLCAASKQKKTGDLFSILREILARSKQKMLEGIILSVPPPYILVLCQSLLECAACPRMVLSLSSWSGGGAGGGSLQCSRSDCSRPSQNYLSAVNNLWQALLLLFLHLRATPPVGSFSFHQSGRL